MTEKHESVVLESELPRFGFGRNWRRFLQRLDDDRIQQAERSLVEKLGVESLEGKRLLDIGSGSGLFSMCARRLGATVHSFDYDPDSVQCTRQLKSRYFPDDPEWTIESGSALDSSYLESLGDFDIVYAWGVLHHTGDMWRALDLAAARVRSGGTLYLAIYRDYGLRSRLWVHIKRFYNTGPLASALVIGVFVPLFFATRLAADLLRFRNPLRRYRDYRQRRGMSFLTDWIDWLGGYPFEFATPNQLRSFYAERGFRLDDQEGMEYVFVRSPSPTS